MEELNEKQEQALKQLREQVKDILHDHHDDHFLIRWLKARQFNVAKAEEMLRNNFLWRKNFEVDTILQWDPPEVLLKYWPGGIFGHDMEGHPILYQLSKDFDAKGMMQSVRTSDIVKYHIFRMELCAKACREMSKKTGKPITSTTNISDLDGFNLNMYFTPCIMDAMKQVFAIYEAHYPEYVHRSYIINAPSVLAIIFGIISPFVSESTKRKVRILGRNWQEELFRVISKEQIPAFWGGDARNPGTDVKCGSYVVHAQPIPTSYYINEKVSLDRDKLRCISVRSGGRFDIKIRVSRAGVMLRWVFETNGYDVGFGVLFCEKDDYKEKAEVLLPVNRVNSHLIPEENFITCTKAGRYTLRFDNTYSWMQSKKVYYDAELHLPYDDPMFLNDTEA